MAKSAGTDYTLTPDELTGLRTQSASAIAGCCTCVFRKDGKHGPFKKIVQLKKDGVTPNKQYDNAFKAEIFIDGAAANRQVTVLTRLVALNATADTARYPGTIALEAADFAKKLEKIPPAIEAAWNARPYKLKVTDTTCGERTFNVQFNVNLTPSSEHFTVDFVNVPATSEDPKWVDYKRDQSWRSQVNPGSNSAKFNLADVRSATNAGGGSTLEPHEYGHMIGLKDEYRDDAKDRNGCHYTFFNGITETVGPNDELMSSMRVTTAQPERYCITISYAVIAIFAENDIKVTKLEIL